MKLAQKLFLSYVVVVVTGLLVLSVATAFVAPGNFTDLMHHMRGMGSGMMSDHHCSAVMKMPGELRHTVGHHFSRQTLFAKGSEQFGDFS
ncbi:MAG: hypothetical protein J0M07_09610, partial [Anaerolineae bacterium]|nr:hypothetical protein [Anaerolineae bacterium]